MAKNHVQPGIVLDITPDADYSSGDLVKYGDTCGVALKDLTEGVFTRGAIQVREVFNVPKLSSDEMDGGITVYLDHVNKRVQLASGDDGGSPPVAFIVAGKTTLPAGNGDTTVDLDLNA